MPSHIMLLGLLTNLRVAWSEERTLRALWDEFLCWWYGCKLYGYAVPTDYGDERSVYCERCGRGY